MAFSSIFLDSRILSARRGLMTGSFRVNTLAGCCQYLQSGSVSEQHWIAGNAIPISPCSTAQTFRHVRIAEQVTLRQPCRFEKKLKLVSSLLLLKRLHQGSIAVTREGLPRKKATRFAFKHLMCFSPRQREFERVGPTRLRWRAPSSISPTAVAPHVCLR